MGLFDRFYLLKHIMCPNCRSDESTEVPINEKGEPTDLGFKVVVLHDGKGGLREFQTKELDCCCMAYYNLPGKIPAGEIKASHIKKGISATGSCNNCQTRWNGNVFVEPIDDCNFFVLRLEAEGLCDESIMMYESMICEHPLYEIDVDQEMMSSDERRKTRLSLKPKIDKCIAYLKNEISQSIKNSGIYEKAAKEIAKKAHKKEGLNKILDALSEIKETTGLNINTFNFDKRREIINLESLAQTSSFYEQDMKGALFAIACLHEDTDPEYAKSVIIDHRLAKEYEKKRRIFAGIKKKESKSLVLGGAAGKFLRLALGITDYD